MTQTPDPISDLLANIRPCKKIVAKELEGKDFKNVLEVGCQWGESLKAIKDIYPDKEYVGVDKSSIELGKATVLLPDIKFVCADAQELPFENESFDVVFTNALFCMVSPQKVEPILNEIVRVSKRYIYLVELYTTQMLDIVDRDRVSANWVALFKARGFEATKRKITEEEWDARPWTNYGHVIFVDKNNKISICRE